MSAPKPKPGSGLATPNARLRAIGRALAPLERLVARWPADADLSLLLHEARSFVGYAEREEERRRARAAVAPPRHWSETDRDDEAPF